VGLQVELLSKTPDTSREDAAGPLTSQFLGFLSHVTMRSAALS